MAAFQLYLKFVEQRKVGWMGDGSNVFGKKFPSEKENVRQCAIVMQQAVLLS
jgi:hypothetical protein